jgi:hypothetical protein
LPLFYYVQSVFTVSISYIDNVDALTSCNDDAYSVLSVLVWLADFGLPRSRNAMRRSPATATRLPAKRASGAQLSILANGFGTYVGA